MSATMLSMLYLLYQLIHAAGGRGQHAPEVREPVLESWLEHEHHVPKPQFPYLCRMKVAAPSAVR